MASQRTFKAGIKSADSIHDDHRHQSIQLRKKTKEETIQRRRTLIHGSVRPVEDAAASAPADDATILSLCAHLQVAQPDETTLLVCLNVLTRSLAHESMFGVTFALKRVIQLQVAPLVFARLAAASETLQLAILQFLIHATEQYQNEAIDQLVDTPAPEPVVACLLRIAEGAYGRQATSLFDAISIPIPDC
jgi:hypothetical protein